MTMSSLAEDCLALAPAEGLSISLFVTGHDEGATASAGRLGALARDLEYSLGEGPGTDAFASGAPVLVDDMTAAERRWPHFVRAADEIGVQAVFALPLHIGAVRLGLMVLYRGEPGSLAPEGLAKSLALADAVAQILVGLQSGADPESLSAALEDGAGFRSIVHQATGYLAAQLDCSVNEALVRLRVAAFATECSLPDAAAEVMAGRMIVEGS
jgi:hypothetical protein